MKKLCGILVAVLLATTISANNKGKNSVSKIADESNFEIVLSKISSDWSRSGTITEFDYIHQILVEDGVNVEIAEARMYKKGAENLLVIISTDKEVYSRSVDTAKIEKGDDPEPEQNCNCRDSGATPYDFNRNGVLDLPDECIVVCYEEEDGPFTPMPNN